MVIVLLLARWKIFCTTQLKQNVSTNVTETYTKALFNKMIDLKDGMSQAASSGSEN